MTIQIKRLQKKTAWSAADRARHERIRKQMQRTKPTPKELMADGEWLPLGAYFALKQAIGVLKTERERAGMTLTALAKRTGIDKAALSRLENGKHANPTLATLMRYAAALGKKVYVALRDAE